MNWYVVIATVTTVTMSSLGNFSTDSLMPQPPAVTVTTVASRAEAERLLLDRVSWGYSASTVVVIAPDGKIYYPVVRGRVRKVQREVEEPTGEREVVWDSPTYTPVTGPISNGILTPAEPRR